MWKTDDDLERLMRGLLVAVVILALVWVLLEGLPRLLTQRTEPTVDPAARSPTAEDMEGPTERGEERRPPEERRAGPPEQAPPQAVGTEEVRKVPDGQARFGYDEIGSDTAYLYTAGKMSRWSGEEWGTFVDAPHEWSLASMGEPFDDIASADTTPHRAFSAYAVYDETSREVSEIVAYISNAEATGLDVEGAIFSGLDQLGSLTDRVAVPAESEGWVSLPYSGGGPQLDPDATHGIALRSEVPDGGVADIRIYYTPMDVPPVELEESVTGAEALRPGLRFEEEHIDGEFE